MIEKLENQLAQYSFPAGSGGELTSDTRSKIDELTNKVQALADERDALKQELEKRSLKGDYDVATTKVVHLR
jgi:archaellum component FlaC